MADMKAPMPAEGAERRRSHRVNIAMPILVRGTRGAQSFEEESLTLSVSAHGCNLRVTNLVARGQEIALVNKKTAEELPCMVTFIGQKDGGKIEIGVEFIEPSPLFWRIAFPPEDWDPAERKRAGGSRPGATSASSPPPRRR